MDLDATLIGLEIPDINKGLVLIKKQEVKDNRLTVWFTSTVDDWSDAECFRIYVGRKCYCVFGLEGKMVLTAYQMNDDEEVEEFDVPAHEITMEEL